MRRLRCSSRRPSRFIRLVTGAPSTYSITKKWCPLASPTSMPVMMFSWLSFATARASRRKRSTNTRSLEYRDERILIATTRSIETCLALYTVPIAPWPMREIISYPGMLSLDEDAWVWTWALATCTAWSGDR